MLWFLKFPLAERQRFHHKFICIWVVAWILGADIRYDAVKFFVYDTNLSKYQPTVAFEAIGPFNTNLSQKGQLAAVDAIYHICLHCSIQFFQFKKILKNLLICINIPCCLLDKPELLLRYEIILEILLCFIPYHCVNRRNTVTR